MRIAKETAALEYVKVKYEEGELKRRLAVVQPIIEASLLDAKDRIEIIAEYEFKLIEIPTRDFDLDRARAKISARLLNPFVREKFDLKAAKEKLGEDVLAPFIFVSSSYNRINYKPTGK